MQIFIFVAILVVSFVLQAVLTPKPKSPENAKANIESDFDFPVADEGTPQIVVFGDVWLTDWYVLWHGNYSSEPITAAGGGGGKK
jgi:hypothetical protein